jgi:colicin import membrane protein
MTTTMNAHSPGAFSLSVLLHGMAAAAVFYFAWSSQKTVPPPTSEIELVMGDGDNYAATEAPSSQGLQMPLIRPLKRLPEPKPEAAEAPEPKPTAVPINPVPTPANKTQMTLKDFLQQNPTRSSASKTLVPKINIRPIDSKAISSALTESPTNNHLSGAGGKALTQPNPNAIAAYVAMLVQRLRAAHQNPEGVGDRLQTTVTFYLGADGTISGLKIVGPSGNPGFDQSVLAAFEAIGRLPPPPTGFAGQRTLAFKVREDD